MAYSVSNQNQKKRVPANQPAVIAGQQTTGNMYRLEDEKIGQGSMPIPSSTHFTFKEMVSKNDPVYKDKIDDLAKVIPEEYRGNIQHLMKQLDVIRDTLGRPIKINSAYRSPRHNRNVNGADKSQHLLGKAADIACDPGKVREEHAIIAGLIKSGKIAEGGLGLYNTFVHYDIRGSSANWNQSKFAPLPPKMPSEISHESNTNKSTDISNQNSSGLFEKKDELEQDDIPQNIFGAPLSKEPQLNYTEDNLRQLIGARFVGAETDRLNQVMHRLLKNPNDAELSQLLAEVKAIRKLSYSIDDLKAQYRKTLDLRKEARAKIEVPDLSNENARFMGSNMQLIFGKVLGDVFNIEPVFGALISPTGGIIGPGNSTEALRSAFDKDGPVALHGAVHDAAGLLFNAFGIGSGYDYMDNELLSSPKSPCTGQTNVEWWIENYLFEMNTVPITDVFAYALSTKIGFLNILCQDYSPLYKVPRKKYDEAMSEIDKTYKQIMSEFLSNATNTPYYYFQN